MLRRGASLIALLLVVPVGAWADGEASPTTPVPASDSVAAAGQGLATPAPMVVGLGDQKAEMFEDPRLRELGIHHVRRVVAWDALRIGWQRRELDEWMAAARREGAEPLVAFSRSRRPDRRRVLLSPRAYGRMFAAFRARYPWARVFAPWNEANHCSQPTCHRPDRAAQYYNVMRASCRRCTVLAADVLDVERMRPWLAEFLRHARGTPRLWGLHNYIDANRFRSVGTRRMLAAVKGDIWFTEVGGLVRRRNRSTTRFPDSAAHAALATTWAFRLARLSPRVRRVYLYNWNATVEPTTWDSALIGPTGRARPALAVVRREIARLTPAYPLATPPN